MGNTINSSSQPTDMKSLASHIDDIAVHYILKQNTIDILRLTDKEYYDNLIVLVGNLFEKKLSDIEIGSLNQRIFPETVQDAVLNLLPTNGKIKDMMIGNISKFYIKIMMIFSAIVSTIDPQYSYDDDTGKKQLFYLKDIKSYKNIPKNVQPIVHQLTNPMNLCRKRISILRNKIETTDPDFITINPGEKLCSTESAGYLTDEIGIKELDLLYYDIFDPETKTWKGRSKSMDHKYKEDLNKFYTIFTGKSELPSNVTSFKDIELFDFRSIEYCRDSLFTHDFIIPKDNELIIRYKEQVDLLEQSTTIYREELLETLKKIFLTKIENENMTYTIQSSLTLQDILNIENETRNTIINLYTNCEQYFIRALLIFEELYDNQSKNMNESRMNNMDISMVPMNFRNFQQNQPLYKEGLINMNSSQKIPIPSNVPTNMNPINNVITRPSNTPKPVEPRQNLFEPSPSESPPTEVPPTSTAVEPSPSESLPEPISETQISEAPPITLEPPKSVFEPTPSESPKPVNMTPRTLEPMGQTPLTIEPPTTGPMAITPTTAEPIGQTHLTTIEPPTTEPMAITPTTVEPIGQTPFTTIEPPTTEPMAITPTTVEPIGQTPLTTIEPPKNVFGPTEPTQKENIPITQTPKENGLLSLISSTIQSSKDDKINSEKRPIDDTSKDKVNEKDKLTEKPGLIESINKIWT